MARKDIEVVAGRQHFRFEDRQIGLVAANKIFGSAEDNEPGDQISVVVCLGSAQPPLALPPFGPNRSSVPGWHSSPKISAFPVRRSELPVRSGKFLKNGMISVGSGNPRPKFVAGRNI